MNKWQDIYQQKLCTAAQAVQLIHSGAICAVPIGVGEPTALLEAMVDRQDLRDVRVAQMIAHQRLRYLTPEESDRFRHISWFTSGTSRAAVQEGRADFVPCFYHEIPMLHRDYWQYDVFFATVSPMDKHGWFSFGVAVSEAHAMMSKAKLVILEVNRFMPRTLGQSMVHLEDVDAVIENHVPLPELASPPLTETDKMIGQYIADRVQDGSVIQLGIGGIPNATALALCSKQDLGIHTEMFTEGMMDMIEAGVVTNRKKNIHLRKCVATFALGTRRLFDFLDDNLGVEFYPVEYVNDPVTVAKMDNFVSINACVEVDLFGQVCSESIGPKQFSGTGGQVDFVRGASKSKGGQSFITTYSTAKGGSLSKIVPFLTPGATVTTSKNDVDMVVTEFGVAKLKGKTGCERARELIGIAHPDFRGELTKAAQKIHLIP